MNNLFLIYMRLIDLSLLILLIAYSYSSSDYCSEYTDQNSCSRVQIPDERFTCVFIEGKCWQTTECDSVNYYNQRRRLGTSCEDLKTSDDNTYTCINIEGYCSEMFRRCKETILDESYQPYMDQICKGRETSDDKKYECVASSDKTKCEEKNMNHDYIKISKLIGLLGLLLI